MPAQGRRLLIGQKVKFLNGHSIEAKVSAIHTIDDFLDALRSDSDEELAKGPFGNRQRTSSKSGILKAGAVRLFAMALREANINCFSDLSNETRLADAEARVKRIKGQTSGISFDYFTLLAGREDIVKADRMVCRFVAEALRIDTVSPQRAKIAVVDAANLLKANFPHLISAILDHLIWSFESQRAAARKPRPSGRWWKISGFDGTSKIFERSVAYRKLRERDVQTLLQRLVAKDLTYDEIISASESRIDAVSLFEISRMGGATLGYMTNGTGRYYHAVLE